jgi:2-dehydro-3-deoxygluconokinase
MEADEKRAQVVFFGELLMRLETRRFERLVQAREFAVGYTGAEANAAVSLQGWGVDTHLVSAVPPTQIGVACVNAFRAFGVNVAPVVRRGRRLGTFYLEAGSAQRPSRVIYDRADSAITELRPGDVPWDAIFAGKHWFHLSGTAPALARETADVVVEACERARANGLKVSIDLNFRSALWRWDAGSTPAELAGRTIRRILPFVNLLIANAGQAADVLGIRLGEGEATPAEHPEIARRMAAESDAIEAVALTLRESESASHNRWGAMLYEVDADRSTFAPTVDGRYSPYEITPIIDRVGAGDSFAAGLIRGMLLGHRAGETLAFAVAASCLKHSIPGDLNLVSVSEVESLMRGDASGRIVR